MGSLFVSLVTGVYCYGGSHFAIAIYLVSCIIYIISQNSCLEYDVCSRVEGE